MGDWQFNTSDPMTSETWQKSWWIEAKTEAYFYGQGLVNTDEDNSVIVEFKDLMQNQGYQHSFAQVRNLSAAGITGDGTLEGNEEAPNVYDDAIVLQQYRHAVRTYGRLSDQFPSDSSVREWARRLLRRWMADKIDQLIFDSLGTAMTKVIYGGTATTTGTLTQSMYFTTNLISKAKAYAMKATPLIIPVSVKGKKYFIMLISPDQAFDLKTRDAAWAQAQREAQIRASDNPIFTGAEGIWDNCVIHVHERVPLSTTWGSGSVTGASAYFMGVQTGAIAYSLRRTWVEKNFDYANKVGIAVGSILGTTKAVFNSADNAFVGVRTSRTNN